MIIEFLIVYHRTADTEIVGVIRDCLAKVLEDNLNEFDSEAAALDFLVNIEGGKP